MAYALMITTEEYSITGPFAITVSGPNNVTLKHRSIKKTTHLYDKMSVIRFS